jgi:HK97 family phage prohead protease
MTHAYRRAVPGVCVRAFDFDLRSKGDGRTLEGHVAVFGAVARIADRNGDFDEEIHRGAFDRSLNLVMPVMQFDHGRDSRVGSVPVGIYETFDADAKGYHVRGRLFDNPVVEPVRQAIAEGAIRGMSWRMTVVRDTGDKWTRRNGDVDKRDILDADVPEAGPVVFPAYDATSVSVRNLLASFGEDERAALIRELAVEVRLAVGLENFTGRPETGSPGGGESGAESGNGNAPSQQQRLDQAGLDRGAFHRRTRISDTKEP